MRIDQHAQFDGSVHRKSRHGCEGNIDTARKKRGVDAEGEQPRGDAVPDQIKQVRCAKKNRIDQGDPDRQQNGCQKDDSFGRAKIIFYPAQGLLQSDFPGKGLQIESLGGMLIRKSSAGHDQNPMTDAEQFRQVVRDDDDTRTRLG
jgi:hypothetical protein